MTTTFRARSGLDDIRFYVDPRSLGDPRSERAEARRPLASGICQIGNSAALDDEPAYARSLHRSKFESNTPHAANARHWMGPTVTSGLQAGSRLLSDGDRIGLNERSTTPVSIPPCDEPYASRCSEASCEPSHASERRSVSDDVEARLREALTRAPVLPATHPEVRLSPQLDASVPQETVENPYEQDSTQDYQCADVSIQDFLDLETDWFAPTDTIQPNPISGAQSLSPHEDSDIVSSYGNTWNDPGFSDPVAVDMDQEDDSSGSDVIRFPRRTPSKRHSRGDVGFGEGGLALSDYRVLRPPTLSFLPRPSILPLCPLALLHAIPQSRFLPRRGSLTPKSK
ncbi:hypothetical protein MBLNU13_g10850t1 [Cladosporium sp. NU13]